MSVITPRAILSYPKLTKPEQPRDTDGNAKGDPKFGAALVFTKDTDLKAMKQAALAVAVEKFGDKKKVQAMIKDGSIRWEGGPHHTFRTDAAGKGYPEGSVFIGARTKNKPGVVDAALNALSDAQIEELCYPGAVVKASVVPYWSDHPQNKGVYWALNNIQYLGPAGSAVDPRGEDGQRLDNVVAAADEFEMDEEAMAELDEIVADDTEDDEVEDIADLLGD